MATVADNINEILAAVNEAYGPLSNSGNKVSQKAIVDLNKPMLVALFKQMTNYVDSKTAEHVAKIFELQTEVSSLKDKNNDLETKVGGLETKVDNLESTVVDLRDQLDALGQYNRRDNLKIIGVPYDKDGDLGQIVKDVMKQNDVEIKDEDISVKHRLHTNNSDDSKPPAIIVRYVRRDTKTVCFNARKNSLQKSDDDVKYPNAKIFEDVTPLRSRILYQLRNRKHPNNVNVWKFVWSHEGRIYCRTEEESKRGSGRNQPKPHIVNRPADLEKLGFSKKEIADIVNNKRTS